MEDECRSTPVKNQDASDREQRQQQEVDDQVEANDDGMGLQDGKKDKIEEWTKTTNKVIEIIIMKQIYWR